LRTVAAVASSGAVSADGKLREVGNINIHEKRAEARTPRTRA
jgi:hypothetical protein